jgi:hypothetical protein
MNDEKLLWVQEKIPETPLAIDADTLDSLLRSRKFRSWEPEPSRQADRRSKRSAGKKKHTESDGESGHTLIGPAAEKHFSPAELGKLWGVDSETIRNLFRSESGVLKIGEKNPKHKRPYLTLRIPESVAIRVHRRLSE